jgi:prepilin-type N-terminal cleavage/methylation domain-containing protein
MIRRTTSAHFLPLRRAFTLVEALLASTILAVVAASAALPFAAGVQQAQEAARLEQAVALGQAMMEEVLARPFFEPGNSTPAPGPDSGETARTLFDNIDDFHGFSESVGGLRNYQNQPITDSAAAGLWRTVAVQYVSFPIQTAQDTNSFVKVTVNVFDGNTLALTLQRLVSRED